MRDLDRAFALARLSGIQSALVQAAREASWGEASMRGEDPRAFRLSPRGLAKVLECHYTKIIDALNDLVGMGILVKTEAGDLLINKDYRTWIDTSKKLDRPPLFSARQIEFITEPKRKRTPRTGSENATAPVAKTLPPKRSVVAKTLPTGSENATAPVAKTLPPKRSVVAKTLPFDPYDIEGPRVPASAAAHASERALREREIKRDLLHPLPLHGKRDDDDASKPLAQREAFQATLREIERWHRDTHPTDLSITHVQISMLLAKAPDHPEWVKEAIEDALLRAQGSKSSYAMTILAKRVADPQAWEREKKARAEKRQSGGGGGRDRVVQYKILTVPPLPEEA